MTCALLAKISFAKLDFSLAKYFIFNLFENTHIRVQNWSGFLPPKLWIFSQGWNLFTIWLIVYTNPVWNSNGNLISSHHWKFEFYLMLNLSKKSKIMNRKVAHCRLHVMSSIWLEGKSAAISTVCLLSFLNIMI